MQQLLNKHALSGMTLLILAFTAACDAQEKDVVQDTTADESKNTSVDESKNTALEEGVVCGDTVCENGQFCDPPEGTCDTNKGECQGVADICPNIDEPVCGCDGETHGNSCTAAVQGVGVAHRGACDGEMCFYSEDEVRCGPDSYCKIETEDSCGNGICEPIVTGNCVDNLEEVCGCDGKSYGNSCYAQREGMSIEHEGPCIDEE